MNDAMLKDEIELISGANIEKCMRCGKCSGACPSYDEMEYHPHQFASMVKNGEVTLLMNSQSMCKCLSCYVCSERCPRDVMPSKIIEAVRVIKLREQGQNRFTADDVENILSDDTPQQLLVSAFRKYKR